MPQSFRDLLLRNRGRTGLTQRDLAARAGVSRGSVQDWENGVNFPTAARLRRLIGVLLENGGFTAGQEASEARDLWVAVQREAPHMRTPFDEEWFAKLPDKNAAHARIETRDAASPAADSSSVQVTHAEDWGEAPRTRAFVGRSDELALARRWVLDDGSRLVAVLGMGGVGKTALTARLAHDVAPGFERVYWRNIRDAPPLSEWLRGALSYLSDQKLAPMAPESEGIYALLRLVRTRRCLLVLDNFEALFEPGKTEGHYRVGMAGYGRLLHAIAAAPNQSCLLLASREKPPELAELDEAVRALELGGFDVNDAQALLATKRLSGSRAQWTELNLRFGGNGLALKIVGETIRELFGGDIGAFLKRGSEENFFGGIRRLLAEQVDRCSALERHVLRFLAVEREPVAVRRVIAELRPVGGAAALEAVEALRRRSLLEPCGRRGAAVTLQSIVLEYMTDRLVDAVTDEISAEAPELLVQQPLIKARAKEYVRQAQERLIGAPLLLRLTARYGQTGTAERLIAMLDAFRAQHGQDQAYGPGNVVNLLRCLRGDLCALDLSGLVIRQAYLAGVVAHDANLASAHVFDAALVEGFSGPHCLALSRDGAYLAAGTFTGDVHLWRVVDRVPLATLRAHAGITLSLALSDDGERLASSSNDGTVSVWNARLGELLNTFHGHADGALSVALSGDGRLVASGDAAGTIRVWSAEDGGPVSSFTGPGEAIWDMALDTSGTVLAAASGSNVQLWEPKSSRLIAMLQGHHGENYSAAVSADASIVASGSFDGDVHVWRVDSRELIATLPGHMGGAWGVALDETGRRLISGSFDGIVRAWDVVERRLIATMMGHTGAVSGAAISGDGGLIASASHDGTVRLWQADGNLLDEFRGDASGIRAVALSATGQLCASASLDRTVSLWDVDQNRLLTTFVGHTGGVWAVAISPDGQFVASAGDDCTVRLWRARDDRPVRLLQGHDSAIWSLAISDDNKQIVSGSMDGTTRIWSTANGQVIAVIDAGIGTVWAVAISRNGRIIASGGEAGTITLWDVPTRSQAATLRGHSGSIWSLALSDNGQLLVSASFDSTARLWDTRTGNCLGVLEGHVGGVWSVALSGDGRLVATAGFDGVVRLWDSHSLRQITSLQAHKGGIWSVAFDEHARVLASGGLDGIIIVWNVEHGAALHTLRRDRIYERMDITDLTGITDSQRSALLALGAVDRRTNEPWPDSDQASAVVFGFDSRRSCRFQPAVEPRSRESGYPARLDRPRITG